MKLELKHLTPYLPYGLQCEYKGRLYDYEVVNHIAQYIRIYLPDRTYFYLIQTNEKEFLDVKPILRPLSDLTEAQINSLLDGDMLQYTSDLRLLRYGDIEKLFEWHFDVFGLIDKGLALDINNLETNKSK